MRSAKTEPTAGALRVQPPGSARLVPDPMLYGPGQEPLYRNAPCIDDARGVFWQALG